jgi:hypothetical protein
VVRVRPEDMAAVVCDDCGGERFRSRLRVLRRTVIDPGPAIVRIEVAKCVMCGRVFDPQVLLPGMENCKVERCSGCDGTLWEQAYTIRQLSALLSPSGKPESVFFPEYLCDQCGCPYGCDLGVACQDPAAAG